MDYDHDVCIEPGCGERSGAHHAFKPPVRPEGCICDPLSYSDPNNIPAICAEFQGGHSGSSERYCKACEHDFECHKAPA